MARVVAPRMPAQSGQQQRFQPQTTTNCLSAECTAEQAPDSTQTPPLYRRYTAEDPRFIQVVGALQALLAAWALLSSVTAGTQPLVSCEWMRLWVSNLSAAVYADVATERVSCGQT